MFAFSLPVLRKEVVSWVSEAEEPALAPLGSWSWQRPPDGQSRQLACGLCELHELMPFWAQDRTEGLYSHCTCPASRSIDFCSQKPSIRVTIPLGLLPCLSPGKKSLGSHAHVMELFSLFSSVFIFVRYFRDQKPTRSLGSGSTRNGTTQYFIISLEDIAWWVCLCPLAHSKCLITERSESKEKH